MSTLEPCVDSIIVSPSLRRRISEIMEEKGKAFTQQALAIRIGMHYETLRKKLRGERELNMFELRRIAEALHLTVERVMQTDTVDDEKKLNILMDNLVDLQQALEVAKKLYSVSIGITERTISLNQLGRSYYLLQQYDSAHETWMMAYEESKKIVTRYDESIHYHQVLSNLLISLTVREDYSNATTMLEEIEIAFSNDPIKLGATSYTKAKIEEKSGNIQNARIHAYKSLEHFEETNDSFRIGRARVTVAHYEFLSKNYEVSLEQLKAATDMLRSYKPYWITSMKEYVKSLIKTNRILEAKEAITSALSCRNSFTEDEHSKRIFGKLHILMSICTGDITEAESVLLDTNFETPIRHLAYRFLHLHCLKTCDNVSLMKYAIIAEELGINKNDVLEEESF